MNTHEQVSKAKAVAFAAAILILLSACGSAPVNNGKIANTGPSREEATLEIVNQSDEAIFYLYLSGCSRDTWGEDQLGSDVIGSGDSYSFRMTPGCWDLRAESASGVETERYGVDMDEGDSNVWTLSSRTKK